jgi:hypothetical protein
MLPGEKRAEEWDIVSGTKELEDLVAVIQATVSIKKTCRMPN